MPKNFYTSKQTNNLMQKKKWSEAKFISVVSMLIFIFLISSSLIFVLQKKSTSTEVNIPSFSGGASSGTGTLSLCLDKAPTLTAPGNKAATANILFNFTINYTDDGCSSVSFSDNTTLFDITSAGLISFTPTESNVNTEAINITISDSFFSRSTLFNITMSSGSSQPNNTKFSGNTTNTSSFADLTNISNYNLSTSLATITWFNTVNVVAQNFDQYVNFSSGFVSVDSANLNISLNSSAQISIENVTCPVDVYFTPYVALSNNEIISNGTLCSSSTDPTCTNQVCSGTTVTFNVSHFTSFGTSSSSSAGGGGAASSGGPIRRRTTSIPSAQVIKKETQLSSITEEQKLTTLSIPSEIEQPKQITPVQTKTISKISETVSTKLYDSLSILLLITLFISLVILSFILSRK